VAPKGGLPRYGSMTGQSEMHNKDVVDPDMLLNSLLLSDRWLPQQVFKKKFNQYLFFDADMRSVDELISAMKDIVIRRISRSHKVAVFSCVNRAFLTWITIEDDWVSKIDGVHKLLKELDDYGGIILVDASMKYIALQPSPVSMGVFAFSSESEEGENWRGISENVTGGFFDIEDVRSWLIGESQRDLSLVESMGRSYLETLVENYR
jgi:hypothetical protein